MQSSKSQQRGRRQAKSVADKKNSDATPLSSQLQRALRESALFVFSFVAIYMVLALVSYHPADPGWSRSGVINGAISNLGGPTGAWFADIFLTLFGYWAYLFPIMLAFFGFLTSTSRSTSVAFYSVVLVFSLPSARVPV